MERIEELDETSDIEAVVAAVRNRADEIRGNLGPKNLWQERVARADELMEIADRIEAAAKRKELRWAKANGDLARMIDLERAQGGDAAKLRKALEWVKERIGGWWEYLEVEDEVEAALAAPPRNCDVGTVAEQNERYKRFCARHYQANNVDAQCDTCPCKEERWDCELEWGQMPYEAAQEGGEHADD